MQVTSTFQIHFLRRFVLHLSRICLLYAHITLKTQKNRGYVTGFYKKNLRDTT
jgi:hypothetical protein